MIISSKKGKLNTTEKLAKSIDWLDINWYEANKRILHKHSNLGKQLSLKFLQENPQLAEGDIIFEDETTIIVIAILACKALVISPKNTFELASVCYEIGNKHLPLFFENEKLLVPFDAPLFRQLTQQGYDVAQEDKKLLQPLKTSVLPHTDAGASSLFSRIMKLTTPND